MVFLGTFSGDPSIQAKSSSGMANAENPNQIRPISKQDPNIHLLS
jgi:hypothetical protein